MKKYFTEPRMDIKAFEATYIITISGNEVSGTGQAIDNTTSYANAEVAYNDLDFYF